ncbi:hypothetical protein GCM10023310_36860 [Paenibacillus vulneris]|uniref:Alcohol dehydrogenase N-terminal domain-containing protein n=1 Tax=Paenibacillus vulneris TaxID=1133364 RepID=A0ABW3UVI0_9BACL
MKKRELTSAIHLHTAALNRTPVVVYIGHEQIGSGVITKITDNSVKIGDDWYMRCSCVFYTRPFSLST